MRLGDLQEFRPEFCTLDIEKQRKPGICAYLAYFGSRDNSMYRQ
jgi:hypothetical protein